ncbi:MAG: hypothetical protein LBS98_01155 [Coriobacteriales bacterium]|nr:hypothetical protein [Coriobacteriales bacterium]
MKTTRKQGNKFLRTVVSIVVVLAFAVPATSAFADSTSNDALYPENIGLTQQEVKARFDTINSTYEADEPFYGSDADFVLRYGINPNTPQLFAASSFSKTVTQFGTTVNYSGTIFHNGTFSYTYGGNVTAQRTAGLTPQYMIAYVHCTAYGVLGSGGAIIIHDGTVSHAVNNANTLSMNKSRDYAGVMVVFYLSTYCDVTTSQGGFTIAG